MSFYNQTKNLIVNVSGDEFVILGDEAQVTDAEILAMSEGEVPAGWERN